MEPTELLRLVGARLDEAGCRRFMTGSLASMVFGEPRFTNDIDMVVCMDVAQVRQILPAFSGDEWYCSPDAALQAVLGPGMFNIIHVGSGLKADVIVSPVDEYDQSRFQRVRWITMPDGRREPFASPEDVILKKRQFHRAGGSSKHIRDITSMIAVQGHEALDWIYLRTWSVRLGVRDELSRFEPAP